MRTPQLWFLLASCLLVPSMPVLAVPSSGGVLSLDGKDAWLVSPDPSNVGRAGDAITYRSATMARP